MPNRTYPRVPLTMMDTPMLVTELFREVDQVVIDARHREMITSAVMIATYAHRAQTRLVRRGLPRAPYIDHPLRNTVRLLRWGVADPNTLAASLLHDVIEDQSRTIVETYVDITAEHAAHLDNQAAPQLPMAQELRDLATQWIRDQYGERVADVVLGVTTPLKTKDETYANHIRDIARNLNGFKNNPIDVATALVKASDLVDNAGSLHTQATKTADVFIERLLAKYTPVIPDLREALAAVGTGPATEAAEALLVVEHNLRALEERIAEHRNTGSH